MDEVESSVSYFVFVVSRVDNSYTYFSDKKPCIGPPLSVAPTRCAQSGEESIVPADSALIYL